MTGNKTGLPVPPESLRWGVGPFADADLFVRSGEIHLQLIQRLAGLKPNHRILDVGCGCGRIAIHMGRFLNETGSYPGFDPDRAAINWCKANIEAYDSRFRFFHLDLLAPPFANEGEFLAEDLVFPDVKDIDIAVLSSVFTHMHRAGIENYINNLHGVLRTGGVCLASGLLMNLAARQAITSGTPFYKFTDSIDSTCWTLDTNNPTEGVSNDEEWLMQTFRARGFEIDALEYGTWRYGIIDGHELHDWYVARKVTA